jgi:hypothetical protein
MREFAKGVSGVGSAILVCAGVYGATPDPGGRQYDVIAPRNIFGLKPEPQAVAPPPVTAPQARIILSGISTITGYKLALLKVQAPAKPGEAPREQSLMLTEGQRDGDVQVLQIDEKNGRVKVNNSGTITTLTFEKNGVKEPAALTNTAVLTPTGPIPPALPSGNPVPGSANPTVNSNVVYPGQKPLPTRFRAPIPAPAGSAAVTTTPAVTNIPLPTVGPPPTIPPPRVPATPQPQLTPEEQAVMMELERELARQNLTNRPALAPQ